MKKLIKFQDKEFNNETHYGIFDIENNTITCLCCGGVLELDDITLPFTDYGFPFPCLENAIKYYMEEESE